MSRYITKTITRNHHHHHHFLGIVNIIMRKRVQVRGFWVGNLIGRIHSWIYRLNIIFVVWHTDTRWQLWSHVQRIIYRRMIERNNNKLKNKKRVCIIYTTRIGSNFKISAVLSMKTVSIHSPHRHRSSFPGGVFFFQNNFYLFSKRTRTEPRITYTYKNKKKK